MLLKHFNKEPAKPLIARKESKKDTTDTTEWQQCAWRVFFFVISLIFLFSFARKIINLSRDQQENILFGRRESGVGTITKTNLPQISQPMLEQEISVSHAMETVVVPRTGLKHEKADVEMELEMSVGDAVGALTMETVIVPRTGLKHEKADVEMRAYKFVEHLKKINFTANPNVIGMVALHRYQITPEEHITLNIPNYDDIYYEFFAKYLSHYLPVCVDIVRSLPFTQTTQKDLSLEELELWKSYDAILPWGMWPNGPLAKHRDELNMIMTPNLTILYELRDKREIIKYIKPLDHIIPTPISIPIRSTTTERELNGFLQNVKTRHSQKNSNEEVVLIRCKASLASGARDQMIININEVTLEELPEGVCQENLDPHDIFVIEGLVSQSGELLDLQINTEFDVVDDHDLYYINGYFSQRVLWEDILKMDKTSSRNRLYHKMLHYAQEFVKLIPFRGMFAIDILFHDGELYFLEINPRLGGSSFIFDKQLRASYLERVAVKYLRQFEAFKDLEIPKESEYEFWKDIYVPGNYERFRPKPEELEIFNQLIHMPEKCRDHPVWEVSPFGECSELCDGGVHGRWVGCSFGDESKCLGPKPELFKECNTEPCSEFDF